VIAASRTNQLTYGNSFTRADAFLGYNFGRVAWSKFLKNLNVQLNVFNVLDQHDPLIDRVVDANAIVLVPNRILPQDPRYWGLAASRVVRSVAAN